MAITSGFFDSIDGDRKYNAEQMSNYFEGLVSDGIYENIGDRLAVTAGGGMTVNVGTGRALIECHWIKNDASLTLTIDPADVQLSRVDAVALRLDKTESGRNIDIVVKKGSSTIPPSMTNTESVHELCLAYVHVPKNATQISQSNISDTRGSSLCSWVTGIIKQVDTADLFLQWQTAYEEYYANSTAAFDEYIAAKQAAFDEWFSTLTGTLHVDTSLKKYQNTVVTTTETNEILIGIPEYETGDILFAHVGGVLFIEDDEYTISGTGSTAKIILKNTLRPGNPVTFIVIKNIIGGDVIAAKIDDINGEVV